MIKIVEVFGMEVSLGLSIANLKEIQQNVKDSLKDIPADITSTVKGVGGVDDAVSGAKSVKGIGEGVSEEKPTEDVSEGISSMVGGIKQMAGAIGVIAIGTAFVGKLLESIQPIIAIIGNIVKVILMPLGLMLFTLLKPVMIWFIKLMPLWFAFVKDPGKGFPPLINKIIEGMGTFIENIGASAIKISVDIIKSILQLPKLIWGFIKILPKLIWNFAIKLPELIWNLTKGLAALIWDFVKELLPEPIVKAVEFVSEKIVKIVDSLFDIRNKFISKLIEIKDNVIKMIGNLTNLKTKIVNKIIEIKDNLITELSNIWTSITSLPQQIWDKIKGLASLIATKIKDILPKIPKIPGISIDDGIITPRGEVIRTNPNDTIFAVKNAGVGGGGGMGKTIIVNITLDRREEDVANQIKRELISELDRMGRF